MNCRKKLLPLIIIFLCFSNLPIMADDNITVSIKRLNMETALRIAQAAIKQCRKEGVQISVTVVDRGGHPQVVLRDVLAMDISLPISKQKAHTAMSFNSALSALTGRFNKPYLAPKIDGLILGAGGIPINIGGNIMGGIGVSGAPSGKTDEKCAVAGLEAVREDLELDG